MCKLWEKVASLENGKFKANQSETDETRLFPLSQSWKEDECGRAEAKAWWLTHQQQGSSDMNWTQSELSPALEYSTALVWKPGEATRSAHTALCCWWAGCTAMQVQKICDTLYYQTVFAARVVGEIKCQGSCIAGTPSESSRGNNVGWYARWINDICVSYSKMEWITDGRIDL